jgi:integrase
MPSIHRDPRSPKGVFYCAYTLASGQRAWRSTATRNRQEAKIVCAALAEAERAAACGQLSTSRGAQLINETLLRQGQQPVQQYRLGDWFTEWLEVKANISPALQKRYRYACTEFLSFLGAGADRRFLDSVQERDIRRFAVYLKAGGRCGATINRIVHTDLGAVFNRAVKLGKIGFNPILSVERQKDDGRIAKRQTFTPEQVAKLVGVSRGTDWEGAVLFAYSSGARLSDVSHLRWDNVDLATGVVTFRQRKLASRQPEVETVVGIHPDFGSWLSRQPALDKSQDFVFPALAKCRPGGKRGLSAQFNQLIVQAGIEAGLIREKHAPHGRSRRNLSFHSLRHTAVSSVFNAAAIKEVQRVTGHAEHGSVGRYVHLDVEAIRAASSLIPRLPTID